MDPTLVTDLTRWSALVAMGVPFLAAWINRTEWASTAKFLVFAAVCFLAAAMTTYLESGLHLERDRFVSSLLVVATLASVYYQTWKRAVQAVERTVNVVPGRPQEPGSPPAPGRHPRTVFDPDGDGVMDPGPMS